MGAGISGLLCATELKQAGRSVCVLDKGRGVGGRMATRRMSGARLDYGAQFLTLRESAIQKYVDAWLEAGLIKEWFRNSADGKLKDGHPRYCGVHGMTDVPKALAEGLEVHCSENVTGLKHEAGVWRAQTESGNAYQAAELVLTAPLPQTLALLKGSGLKMTGAEWKALQEVRYARGLSALLILDGPSELPAPGARKVEQFPLAWISDNQVKGISPEVPSVTVHADTRFADLHWDSPDELCGSLLVEAARALLKASVVDFACHRWGYAYPLNPAEGPFFRDALNGLTVAGDGFGPGSIGGAAKSGIEAGRMLVRKSR